MNINFRLYFVHFSVRLGNRAHQLEGIGPRQRRRTIQDQEAHAAAQIDERLLRSRRKY